MFVANQSGEILSYKQIQPSLPVKIHFDSEHQGAILVLYYSEMVSVARNLSLMWHV